VGDNVALLSNVAITFSDVPNAPAYPTGCTDANDAAQLNDGSFAPGDSTTPMWKQEGAVGWQNLTQPLSIIVDLGVVRPIQGVEFSTAAGTTTPGVEWPTSITLWTSDDNSNWEQACDVHNNNLPIDLVQMDPLPAAGNYATDHIGEYVNDKIVTYGRYVKFVVTASQVFVDEIQIYQGNGNIAADCTYYMSPSPSTSYCRGSNDPSPCVLGNPDVKRGSGSWTFSGSSGTDYTVNALGRPDSGQLVGASSFATNKTGHTIQAGEEFRLVWDAASSGSALDQTASLVCWNGTTQIVLASTTVTFQAGGAWNRYGGVTFTAQYGQDYIGKPIEVKFTNVNAGTTYFDKVELDLISSACVLKDPDLTGTPSGPAAGGWECGGTADLVTDDDRHFGSIPGAGAFLKAVTDHKIFAGDQFHLTWQAKSFSESALSQTVSLVYKVSDSNWPTIASQTITSLGNDWYNYVWTFTAVPGQPYIGKEVAVKFTTEGAGNVSTGIDKVAISCSCTDATQLTDGAYIAVGNGAWNFWSQTSTVGWHGQSQVEITIDLGSDQPIEGASVNATAGRGKIAWPEVIDVLTSTDNINFYDAGDLVSLSADHGLPPAQMEGEAGTSHSYWTDRLTTHGRYVKIVLADLPELYLDEIEVYRARSEMASQPYSDPITNMTEYVDQTRKRSMEVRRIVLDAQDVKDQIEHSSSNLSASQKASLLADLNEIIAQAMYMPAVESLVLPLDPRAILVNRTGTLVTTEAGGTASFTVRLGMQPTANVTIALLSSDPTEGTVSSTSLTFTPTNWSIPQTVTVTGVSDTETDDSVDYAIAMTAASTDEAYNGLKVADVPVRNDDANAPGITVTPTVGLTTTAAGGTATFTVTLNSQPTADVTIPLSSSGTGEGTLSLTTLTFTSSNWSTPQTVTVTGQDDGDAGEDVAYVIQTGKAVSTDLNYKNMDAADVSVTNCARVRVSPTMGLTTAEDGGAATFTVVLTAPPTADVTIGLSSSNTNEGTVSPASLTFTSTNWNTPQTVTVTGVDDSVDRENVTYTIVTTATSTDPNYNNVNVANVVLTNNPTKSLHKRVFADRAELLRAQEIIGITTWQTASQWDYQTPTQALPEELEDSAPTIDVTMMLNEYRSAAFNVTNPTNADATVTLSLEGEGLPGGPNPSYVTVQYVEWIDTTSGSAAALPLIDVAKTDDGFTINVPSGMTRQVWLTFHPTNVSPGTYGSTEPSSNCHITISSDAAGTATVPIRFELSSLSIDAQSLLVSGFDHTEGPDDPGVMTDSNLDLAAAQMQSHGVNLTWARYSVMTDTAQLNAWLDRWVGPDHQYGIYMAGSLPAWNDPTDPTGERLTWEYESITDDDQRVLVQQQFEAAVAAWLAPCLEAFDTRNIDPSRIAILPIDEPDTAAEIKEITAWAKAIKAREPKIQIWETAYYNSNPSDPAYNTAWRAMCHEIDVVTAIPSNFVSDVNYRDAYTNSRGTGVLNEATSLRHGQTPLKLNFHSAAEGLEWLDPYSYYRLTGWLCSQYNATSASFWRIGRPDASNYDSTYPNEDCSQDFLVANWRTVYPDYSYSPIFVGPYAVTDGKQMEAIREGAEDYQYVQMVKNRIEALKEAGHTAAAAVIKGQLDGLVNEVMANYYNNSRQSWAVVSPAIDRATADVKRIAILHLVEGLAEDEAHTPTVVGVTSTDPNGCYTVDDTVDIQVTFDENVCVTGTPQLPLETGTTDRFAEYVSGTGTKTLTFRYVVQPGDLSSDLDYTDNAALLLNGGSIADLWANGADLALPDPGSEHSLGANCNVVVTDVLYWDADGDASGGAIGGNGTWTTGDFWRVGSATGPLHHWVDGVQAVLAGSGGTVSIAAPISAQSITFAASGNYTVTSTLSANTLSVVSEGTDFDVESAAATISSPIVGSGGITKTGGAALTLRGENTYDGTTEVEGGVLNVVRPSATPRIDVFVVNSGATAALSYSSGNDNWSFNATLNGGTLTTADVGAYYLYNLAMTGGTLNPGQRSANGYNTFLEGNVTVHASDTSSQIGGSGLSLYDSTRTFNVADGAAAADLLISGPLTNAQQNAAIVKTGDGTLVLNGANTYSGGTTVNTGTLQIGGSVARNISIAAGTSLVFANTSPLTYDGVISGGGAVTKMGPSALTLTGENTYSGKTTVEGGLLNVVRPSATSRVDVFEVNSGATAALSYSSGNDNWSFNATLNGGTLTTADAGAYYLYNLDMTGGTLNPGQRSANGYNTFLEGDVTVHTSDTSSQIGGSGLSLYDSTRTFNVANGPAPIDLLISGPLTNAQQAAGIVKAGDGTLVLNGANTYSGGTTVDRGTLEIGGSVAGNISIAAGTSLVFANASPLTYDGAITGGGAVTKTGACALTFTGDSNYGGGTTINGGVLQLGDGSDDGSIGGNIANNAGLVFANSNSSQNYNGAISGSGWLTKTGAGTLTLSGTNSYTGTTTISQGTLSVADISVHNGVSNLGNASSAVALGSASQKGKLSYTGPLIEYTRGFTVGAGGGEINNVSGHKLTIITNGISTAGELTFSGDGYIEVYSAISSSGSLKKTGTNSLKLAGGNSYGGITTIEGGTVQVGDNGPFGSLGQGDVVNDSSLTFFRTGTLIVGNAISGGGSLTNLGSGTVILNGENNYSGGTTVSAGTLQIGCSIAGNISTAASTSLVFANTSPLTYDGAITGGGAVTKTGAGALTFTGESNYGGGTTINGGVLQLGDGSDDGSIGGNIANYAGLVFANSNSQSYNGVISGSGSLTKIGDGALTLSGANTYTGTTTISQGTLSVGDVTVDNGVSNLGNASSAVVLGSDSQKGKFSYTGPTATYTRGFTVGVGGGEINNVSGHSLTIDNAGGISNGGELTFSGTSYITVRSAIFGSGSLKKIDNNSLKLVGGNTYAGTTTIQSGNVQVGDNGSSGALGQGDVFNDSSLTFWRTGTLTVSNAISGGGSLEKNGVGTVILTNANTYSGNTTINAGTLQIDGSLSSSSTATVSVNSGSTLAGTLAGTGTINRAVSVASGATLSPGGNAGLNVGTLTVGYSSGTGVSFASGSFFRVDINTATSGYTYDVLHVHGSVSLNGCTLSLFGNAALADGTSLTIIDNDGTTDGNGSFGNTFPMTFNGVELAVNYAGGDGNDVVLSHSNLQAASYGGGSDSASDLTQADLQPIIAEAIARWAAAGLDTATVARLSQVQFVIDDLDGCCLGKVEDDQIYLDVDAAGYGWFVDSTPTSDEEYASSEGTAQAIDPRAVDRIDLLTVVEHELGHIAGFDDLDSSADDVMAGILSAGVRRHC
jgi:autotransporter-associated beta strand protein